MTIRSVQNAILLGLTTDAKPSNYAIGTLFIDDLGDIYRWNGSAWDFLDGATLTETLTNKTMYADLNTFSGISQDMLNKRTGYACPVTGASVVTLAGACFNQHTFQSTSGVDVWDATEGLIAQGKTTTTVNQNAGLLGPTAGLGVTGITRRDRTARMRYRGAVDAVASSVSRLYVGYTSNTTMPISDTPLATTDSGIFVGFRSTDANYQIFTNNGGGSALTATPITGNIAKNTLYHTIEINWAANGNPTIIFDGVSQTISTALPATTTALGLNALAQNATAAIRTHNFKGVWFEST